MSWEDSRANCLGYGADLVSILTSSESDFIYQQIGTKGAKHSFWIGLFRNKVTGNWTWSDGNSFTKSRQPQQWATGQPNDDNENCACIDTGDNGWHDYNCTSLFSSVCKRRKGAPNYVSLFSIMHIYFKTVKPFLSIDHPPSRQTFELGKFISWKEHRKFSKMLKFGYKILQNVENTVK